MKERLQLQLSVEEGEKEKIAKFYKDRAMSVAGRALMLIREDIKKMEAVDSDN